jgi:hypothetical protein
MALLIIVVSLSSFDTDNLLIQSEGSSNLYYTDARVNSFLTTNSYATQSFVNTAVSNLVDSAPSTLDTLNELAAALGDDANFSTTTATSLGNRLRIDVSNQGLTSTQKTNALTNLGINSEYSGNSATATALATARTIHGVSFDGTANIDLSEVIQDTVGAMFSGNTETNITATYEDSDGTIDLVVATLNQDTTGNSATATALETARTIHGVSFDGTANIDLSEVIQDTVGAMFSSNTETGITATYEDGDGTIDLVVASQTANDFTTTLKNKLDGIEASATADQSDSEIKTAYENNSDTNAFTDALLSKLNGIEANATADQTAEEIQDIVGAMFSSNTETGITATYQDSDGTIDLVVTGSTPTSITDADGDTKIQVEESSDEDKIRFDTGGSESMVIDSSGRLSVGIPSSAGGVATFFGTGTGAEAKVQIEGEGGADPFINFLVNNTTHWAVGARDSDSDKFMIANNSDLSSGVALTIDASENVGIGVTSPDDLLTISKNASSDSPSLIVRRSTDTSSSGDFVQGIKFANGTLSQRAEIQAVQGSQYADNIALNFVTMAGLGNRGTRMHIGGTGEVGIGTDNPVSVGGHDGVLTLFGSNATALVLKNNTSTSRLAQLGSDLAFFVDTYETERLRIKSGGAVLIGTTDLSSGTGIQLKNEEFHVNIANGSSLFRNVRSDTAGNSLTLDRNTGDGDLLDLKKADSSQGTIGVIGNDIFINSTDEGRLHVGGTGRYSWSDTSFSPQNDNARDLGSSSARWKNAYLSSTLHTTAGLINTASSFSSGALDVRSSVGNATEVIGVKNDNSGSYNVMMKFYRQSTAVGRIDWDNTGGFMAFTNLSDGRLKNVTGEARGLDLITKLNPVKYYFKDNDWESEGLVAQEVEQAYQDLGDTPVGVRTPESDDDYYQLSTSHFVINLIKAVKQQQEQIESLKSEIQLLKGGN